MQSINWAREHCDALREYHAKGMSFAEIAEAINAKFKTDYSRNAAIGRARRIGLADPERPKPPPKTSAPQLDRIRERDAASLADRDAGVRTGGDGQAALCRNRSAPSFADRS